MNVDDLDKTPTVVLLHQTLALARSEPALQSDEYWTHVQALHFRGGSDVFEEAVGLCVNPDPTSRAVGADLTEPNVMTLAIEAAAAMPRPEFVPHLEALHAAHPDDETIFGALSRSREAIRNR
jgi:hypothetical protein